MKESDKVNKNILIIGAARSGKTTLARKISKEYNYNLISLDDIISGCEGLPECNIRHFGDENEVSKNLSQFLNRYLKELAEGPNFNNDCKYVIEGTHIDFEELMPFLETENLLDKYEIIGLTYNNLTEKQLYENIKKYDTEDDWTYWSKDEDLKGDVRYFLERNNFFNEKFEKYNITSYDTSMNRKEVLDSICNILFKISVSKKR